VQVRRGPDWFWRRFRCFPPASVHDLGSCNLRRSGGFSCASSHFLPGLRPVGVAASQQHLGALPRGPAVLLRVQGPNVYRGAVLRRGPLSGARDGDHGRAARASFRAVCGLASSFERAGRKLRSGCSGTGLITCEVARRALSALRRRCRVGFRVASPVVCGWSPARVQVRGSGV